MNQTICYEKNDFLPLENFSLSERFSHLKFVTNATSHKLVVVKRVTSKFVSQDLVLQNYFESLSSDEQKTRESCMSYHLGSGYS